LTKWRELREQVEQLYKELQDEETIVEEVRLPHIFFSSTGWQLEYVCTYIQLQYYLRI